MTPSKGSPDQVPYDDIFHAFQVLMRSLHNGVDNGGLPECACEGSSKSSSRLANISRGGIKHRKSPWQQTAHQSISSSSFFFNGFSRILSANFAYDLWRDDKAPSLTDGVGDASMQVQRFRRKVGLGNPWFSGTSTHGCGVASSLIRNIGSGTDVVVFSADRESSSKFNNLAHSVTAKPSCGPALWGPQRQPNNPRLTERESEKSQ